MSLTKPYIKKPLAHSPQGEQVLKNVTGYLIWVTRDTGPGTLPVQIKARVRDPGQCIAALRMAKEHNVRCLVYALGPVYGMEHQELVDEEFLLTKIGGNQS